MTKPLFKIAWLALLMALTLSLFVPYTAVLASNTSQASYYAVIRVSNDGTSAAYNVSVPLIFNTTYMINGDYMVSNLSNTAMIDNNGDNGYYNPAVVTNTTWMIFVPYIPADSSIDYTLYMGGNLDMSGNKSWFAGTTGGTTANSTSLNHFDFVLNQTGYLDTSYYAGKNLSSKAGVFVCNISAAQEVNFTLFGCNSVKLTGIHSGFHRVSVQATVTGAVYRILLDIDGNIQSYFAGGGSFTPTNSSWQFSGNNTWPALEHQTIRCGGTLVQDIRWQNAAIWVDSSGYGNNLTPTFRTATTNANVSAVLYDLQTDHEAILTDWDLNNYTNNLDIPDMPGGMYDATPTFPGTGVVNDISDAGGYPRSTLWFILPTVLIVAASLMLHDRTKSLGAQLLITLLFTCLMCFIHVWPFWVIIPQILIGGAALLASKIMNY